MCVCLGDVPQNWVKQNAFIVGRAPQASKKAQETVRSVGTIYRPRSSEGRRRSSSCVLAPSDAVEFDFKEGSPNDRECEVLYSIAAHKKRITAVNQFDLIDEPGCCEPM